MTQTPSGHFGYARVPQRRDAPPPLAQRDAGPPPLAQRRPVEQRRDARFQGIDPSGAVRISLDELGRVCAVALARTWRDEVGPEGLGRAVVEAAGAAQQHSVEAWDRSTAEEARLQQRPVDGQWPVEDQWPVEGQWPADRRRPRHWQSEDRQMSSIAMDVTSRVEAASRGMSDAALRTVEGESPEGRAIIALRAGQLVGAAFQMAWLASADRSAITEHIQAAYDSAYALAQLPDGELPSEGTGPSDNTFELLRRFGLDPRS